MTMKNSSSDLMGGSDDGDLAIVSLSMIVTGLGYDHDMTELEDQMFDVMERTVLRTSDRVPELTVIKVETAVREKNRDLLKTQRSLEELTQYYDVHVVRDGFRLMGPIIIKGMQDDKTEIIQEIQGYTDTTFWGTGEVGINFCTIQKGEYDLCMIDAATATPVAPVNVPSPAVVQSDPGSEGLAGWVVALIVLFAMLVLGGLGYFVFVSFVKKNDKDNLFVDDKSRASDNDRSRAVDGIWGSFDGDETSLPSVRSQRSRVSATSLRSVRSQRTVNSTTSKQRQGSDPPMFAIQEQSRPDPDSGGGSVSSRNSDVLCITDGSSSRRYYSDDPPLHLQRDPTMYVDGHRDQAMFVDGPPDPTTYMDDGQYSVQDPPLKPMRDPSMYMEGQQDPSTTYIEEGTVEEAYNDDRGGEMFGMGGINEEEYDNFAFEQESPYPSESVADVGLDISDGGRNFPSRIFDDASFKSYKTKDPSVSSKSARSEKSVSSKSARSEKSKKSRRKHGEAETAKQNSLHSWGADTSNRSRDEETRKTRSFYD